MNVVRNPVIPGFNPDPSIVRVGQDYYIATSTFEWFPGVQLHHSRDLVNWELLARPLDATRLLDLRGVPDSCGVWAPCLSYADGTFYLVYSSVKSFDGPWKDTPNFLTTATDISGPWSDPVFLSGLGFDGSLFHDDDGRKWFVSMLLDHRFGAIFGGIWLQEFSEKAGRLVGEGQVIFEGSPIGMTEGPHLYKKDDWYYLLTAEGGTEYEHAVSVARSRQIGGPYELHPSNPLVTCAGTPDHPLQKAGHGDLVQTPEGDWYIVFLIGRPLTQLGRCTLGRETAIEEIEWRDGWPWLSNWAQLPRLEVPFNVAQKAHPEFQREEFKDGTIGIDYQSLRIPMTPDWCDLESRPGYLRLHGRDSLVSTHRQSLIARRVQDFSFSFTICIDFEPAHFQQMSGLVCYYNTGHYFYLCMSRDDASQRYVKLYSSNNFLHEVLAREILPNDGKVWLQVKWEKAIGIFYYRNEDVEWTRIGPECDMSILSDDYIREGSDRFRPAFTGSFVGICCQDLAGTGGYADFEFLEYRVS